jgi:hypothetical protein
MFDRFDPRDRDEDSRDDFGIYDQRWDDPRQREEDERERDRDWDETAIVTHETRSSKALICRARSRSQGQECNYRQCGSLQQTTARRPR